MPLLHERLHGRRERRDGDAREHERAGRAGGPGGATERVRGDDRGDGRRTRVWVDGMAEPLVAARTERTILADMGEDTAFRKPLLDDALDLAERLAERPQETEFEHGLRRFGMLITRTVFFLVLFILVVRVAMHKDAFESFVVAVALAAINVFGGFLVTQRMLDMFKKKGK